ncbi:MAG: hypothetical protein ACFCVD_03030 [Nodosilinea sp.]
MRLPAGLGHIDKTGQILCPGAFAHAVGQQNGGIGAALPNGLQHGVAVLPLGKAVVDNAHQRALSGSQGRPGGGQPVVDEVLNSLIQPVRGALGGGTPSYSR